MKRLEAPLRLLPHLLAALATTGTGLAHVDLSGPISDDTTGPLVTGEVYHLVGTVTVPAGKTLTIQEGAIVKGTLHTHILVYGTVDANGTSVEPIVLTSITDDSAGGDTNGDGASAGAAGEWRGVFTYGSSSCTFEHVELRYAGGSGYAGIHVGAAGMSFTDCTIRDCAHVAIDHNSLFTTVVGCSFVDNGGVAADRVRLESMATCSGNSASGNAGGDFERITAFAHAADLTLGPGNFLGGVLVAATTLTVADGYRLTLAAGLVGKFTANVHVLVRGDLQVLGTSGQPVVLTAFADDDHGGDTNFDGPSVGTPGAWRGLYMYPTSSGSLVTDALIRYTGGSGYAAVELVNSNSTLTDCTIRDGSGDALDMNGASADAVVTGCALVDNGGLAVDDATLQGVPGFSGNTASGNALGDYIEVKQFSHSEDLTIGLDNCLNGVLVITATPVVAAGLRLTFEAGLVLKFTANTHVLVYGNLQIAGTPSQPVVLTAFDDDDHAGDTNADGFSQGSPGHWRGFYFYGSSGASVVDNALVRYTGSSSYAGITLVGPDLTLKDCTVCDGSSAGLDLGGNTEAATISGCTFADNGGVAATNVLFRALPGLSGNVATGNAGGDYTLVTNGSILDDTVVGPDNVIGDLLVVSTDLTATAGTSLTLQAGLVLKFTANVWIIFHGDLLVQGTVDEPVVLTSIRDDSVVGDTDGVGPPAAPGDWRGIYLYASSSSDLRHVRLRFPGATGYPGVTVLSPTTLLNGVRIDHAANDGFELTGLLADPSHLVAHDCGARGVELLTGSFQLRRTTAVGNGQEGIHKDPAFAGGVVDCISVDNGLDNYSGFVAGEVRYSNGSPAFTGSDGNIDVDPLFQDRATGALVLLEGSPCIDTGDPLSPLDPDSSRADMGAYFWDHCLPVPYCTSKQNSAGCTPAITWSGYPSFTGDDDFHVEASDVVGQTQGYLLWSLQPNPPFPGVMGPSRVGTKLCVFRSENAGVIGSSGTAGQCDGILDFHFSHALMTAAGLVPGTTVYVQFVYEDPLHPDGSGWSHTDALRFQVCR